MAAVNGGKKVSGKEGGEAAAAPNVVNTVAQVRTLDFILSEMEARRSGERGSDISHYISECSLCPLWKTDGGQENLWACVNRSRGRQSLHGLRWYDGGGIGWLRFGTYSEGKSNMCLNSRYEL